MKKKSKLCFIFVLASFLLAKPISSFAAQHQWGASYLDWSGADLSKDSTVTQVIQPLEISPNMYWESGWHWNNAPDGGYGGIQSHGILANGQISDLAIFSIWNATSAIPGEGAGCTPFGGEGIGYSCRTSIKLVAGNKYQMSFGMEILQNKQYWKAIITDLSLLQTKVLGWIEAPAKDLKATNWNNFIEYWGQAVSCDAVGNASAKFYVPTSNNPEVEFHSPTFSRPLKPCVNSSGETPPRGFVGDAIMRFGGPNQMQSITSLPGVKNKTLVAADKAAAELKAKQEAEAQAKAEAEALAEVKQSYEAAYSNFARIKTEVTAMFNAYPQIWITNTSLKVSLQRALDYKYVSNPRQSDYKDLIDLLGGANGVSGLVPDFTMAQLEVTKFRVAQAKASKPTTSTCVKGKLTKKVTAVNPKCPKGYKKK